MNSNKYYKVIYIKNKFKKPNYLNIIQYSQKATKKLVNRKKKGKPFITYNNNNYNNNNNFININKIINCNCINFIFIFANCNNFIN